MTWVLLKSVKAVKNPHNQSRFARRKSAKKWEAAIRPEILQWKNNLQQVHDDLFRTYEDLEVFAADLGFVWPQNLGAAVPLGRTVIERECLVPIPNDFRDILEDVLGDIAQVALTSCARRGSSWPLLAKGWLTVNSKKAALPGREPSRFQELNFYFYKGHSGADPHFYWWRMQYRGDAALSSLIIDNGAAFSGVTKVSDSVWIVDRTDQGQLVVKYESPKGMGDPGLAAVYKKRYEYTTWLAGKAFEGVPTSALLTDEELLVISGLTGAEVNGPNFTTDFPLNLQKTLVQVALERVNNPATDINVFTKMMPVAMGRHLERRIDNLALADDQGQAVEALRAFVFVPAKLTAFGAIAVFDLIVSNNDRFPALSIGASKYMASLKNIDFTENGDPIALDNVDPVGPAIVNDSWPGKVHLISKQEQKAFARMVVNMLIRETKSVSYYATRADSVNDLSQAFYDGMREGTVRLKRLEKGLRERATADDTPHGTRLANTLANRIQATAS